MRPFGAWFGRLAMAGACLAGAGCGGGDVPDPDSDSRAAAAESAPRVVDKGTAGEAAAPEPAAPEPNANANALASNVPSREAETASPSPSPAKPADPEPAAPALKGDASGTEEMLRIAGSPGATPPAGDSPTPGGSPAPSTPTVPGMTPGMTAPPSPAPGDPGPGMRPDQRAGRGAMGGGPLEGAAPSGPGRPGEMQSPGGPGAPPAPRTAGGPGQPGIPGGPQFGGPPGGPGGSFGQDPSSASGPASFRFPGTAVQAFLAALKAKDKDRLSQATARRAPTEADEKHRKIFAAIIDQSISDDELDEMSKALEGFQIAQVLQAKSTGQIKVIVFKMSGRDRLQRTIVTRKEKEGWKVMDVESLVEFKAMPTYRRPARR